MPVTNSGGKTTNFGIFAPAERGCAMLSPEEEENSRKVIAKELDIDEDLLK